MFFLGYTKIFSHNSEGGLFKSRNDAMYKNPDNSNANLFSILNQIENYRKIDGNFQFKLCYPDFDKCNEWIQSSNPVTETKITGFRAISLDFKKNGVTSAWAGLGKSISNTYSEVLIDDAPTSRRWHCAIGACGYWPRKPRIPGPHGIAHSWAVSGVTKVELYVWNEK